MRRSIVLLGLAAGILGALAFWLWPPSRPHLLLVTLDTTRADHLGCYGFSTARTPVLDALAAGGILFERADTVAPLTLPAHTSLFTGLYPAETGIRTNGRGKVDDELPTLAAALKRQGYDTAAFVASMVLDGKFGLERGFNQYDDDIVGDDSPADSLHRQRRGEVVVDAALEWLGLARKGPWFCWVHLYDPHVPYEAHSDLFGDEFAERPYDAEIAYVDRQVGRLVDFLKARGLDDQTLVVVLGDHGEGLGEHVERAHGMTLYNVTTRVPLIFRYPGRLTPGRRVSGDVSLVDVSPTILDLLGLPPLRKVTGRSIKPALFGGKVDSSPCYSATDEPFLLDGWSPLRSLTEGDWKYIRTTRVELYDLANDPGERHNLAQSDPGRVQALESRMAAFESRLVARAPLQVQLTTAERRALASLGYAGGANPGPAGPAPANLPDIKDVLPFVVAVEEARDLVTEGSADAGIARLRAILAEAPSHSMAYTVLARALMEKGKFDEAIQAMHALLTIKHDSIAGHHGLGNILLAQGNPQQAIAEYTKAVELDPDFAEAQYGLGAALARIGQPEEAIARFGMALELDHTYADAYQSRANLLANLGRIPEAIADWRMALKYSPDDPDTHHHLGIVLADHGQPDEARQHLVRAVELSPEDAGLQKSLGVFFMRQGRYDNAIEHLQNALQLKPGYVDAEEQLQKARQALKAAKSEI